MSKRDRFLVLLVTGGDIKINAQQITLEAGGQISASTVGQGKGGSLTLIDTDAPIIIEENNEANASPIEKSVQHNATDAASEDADIEAQLIIEANAENASPVEESHNVIREDDRPKIPDIEIEAKSDERS